MRNVVCLFGKGSLALRLLLRRAPPTCYLPFPNQAHWKPYATSYRRYINSMDSYNSICLSQPVIDRVAEDAIDWAYTHGIVMKNKKDLRLDNFAPFTLFPSPFPEYLFNEALAVQEHFHTLVQNARQDHEFLQEALKSVILHDNFTKRLYDLYTEVQKEGIRQPITVYLVRSDYMIHDVFGSENVGAKNNGDVKIDRQYEIKQIEINLIASSFAGLGTQTYHLHRHVCDLLGKQSPFQKDKLPYNSAVKGLGLGLAKAWKAYGNEKAAVLFVVEAGEKNRYDQRLLQYEFHEGVKTLGGKAFVPVIYKALEEIYKDGILSDDYKLILEGHEIAVAYFRAGYTPGHYPVEESWKGRRLIERSMAIKSPDITGHLLGTKKVQQILAKPGVLERFIKDEKALKDIRRTFAGLYSLDPGTEGDQTETMALQNPSSFVLKPQREGGGNNAYGEDIVSVLKAIKDPAERGQYILMERVNTPVYKNYIAHIDFEEPRLLDVVNELGIYGVLLLNVSQKLVSETVGYLVRTKSTEHDDGGVAAGRAVLDSAYLI